MRYSGVSLYSWEGTEALGPTESSLRHLVATLVYSELPTEFSSGQCVVIQLYTGPVLLVYLMLFSGRMELPRSHLGSSSRYLKSSRGILDLMEAYTL